MERTWDIIKWLIEKHDYSSYLEIGCKGDATFNEVMCARKVGVDPARGGTHRMTSDEYFSKYDEKFDVVFIDGLHEREQVMRDFHNALSRLNDGGIILLHDCDPPSEERQRVPQGNTRGWCGDVWKAYVEIRTMNDVDAMCTTFDMGMGVVKVRPNSAPAIVTKPFKDLTWDDLQQNRQEWLRITPTAELLEWISKPV